MDAWETPSPAMFTCGPHPSTIHSLDWNSIYLLPLFPFYQVVRSNFRFMHTQKLNYSSQMAQASHKVMIKRLKMLDVWRQWWW